MKKFLMIKSGLVFISLILFILMGMMNFLVARDMPVKVSVDETTTFKDVAKVVREKDKKYGVKEVLIVLDIDNTLLSTTQDIGGDIWYRWQRGKFKVKPSKKDQVPCLFEDTIGLLYELVPMKITEKGLPKLVSGWQSAGNTVMALTSRGPNIRAATERELIRNGFDLDKAALKPKGSSVAPVYRERTKRELSYMKGVMMTSGMNKGTMLNFILEKTGRNFKAIIFVDDSKKHVNNVAKAFSKSKHGVVDITSIHYTKIEKDRINKNGVVLTQDQANVMAKKWSELNATLNRLIPARNTGVCLGK